MIFDVFRAVETESVQRLPLDESVDEIGGLYRPSFGNVLPLDLNLFRKNVVPNLSSVPASVWSSAEHAFVPDDAHGKIVNGNTVRLPAPLI